MSEIAHSKRNKQVHIQEKKRSHGLKRTFTDGISDIGDRVGQDIQGTLKLSKKGMKIQLKLDKKL